MGRKMRVLALLLGLASLAACGDVLFIPSPPAPQSKPMTWQQKYNACANNGRFDQRLSGQQLINYIDNCVKQPMFGSSEPPTSSWNEMYAACADEGRFQKNYSGQELTNFIWQCASQPVSGTSLPPTEASWQDKRRACADDGRLKKGLSGNDLINFVDTCLANP
jgi:hypothetical protein